MDNAPELKLVENEREPALESEIEWIREELPVGEMPPERYVALNSYHWFHTAILTYQFPDPEVDRYARRVHELLHDWRNRAALRREWLSAEEREHVASVEASWKPVVWFTAESAEVGMRMYNRVVDILLEFLHEIGSDQGERWREGRLYTYGGPASDGTPGIAIHGQEGVPIEVIQVLGYRVVEETGWNFAEFQRAKSEDQSADPETGATESGDGQSLAS